MIDIYKDRVLRARSVMKVLRLDMLLITDGYNVHYLSGYSGHCGVMLITADREYVLTDSRYTEQVTIEAPQVCCVDISVDGYATKIAGIINEEATEDVKYRVGFENEEISYKGYKTYNEKLNNIVTGGVELVELGTGINKLRMVKSNEEIECIAKAEAIGDAAFEKVVDYIKPGLTEKEVAIFLENEMKLMGASGLSFDTIAASGKNSSLPHAVPTDKVLEEGDFLTMDFGCVYKGYCSDMTRTVYIGKEPSKKQKLIYDTVLKAQLEALKLIKPGVKCSDVDACARKIIADAGFGEFFGHGLGHSVGLYIHEEPRCSRRCDTILEEGMTMTCEPGIYLPGEFGVRIEDLVVVTGDGYRNLTVSDKNLRCIG